MKSAHIEVNPRLQVDVKTAAAILRSVGSIVVSDKDFEYAVAAEIVPGEGCVTHKAFGDDRTELIFTPFNARDRVLEIEDRIRRIEGFAAALRDGFPQLANVVSFSTLQRAAEALGPIR